MAEKITWNATRLGAAAALGVLLFIINLVTGMLIILATGIPAGGGVFMVFIVPMLLVLTALLIPISPSATIAAFVCGLLSLSVPILGPPGFLPKVVIVLVFGLGCDVVMLFLRKKEKVVSALSGLVSVLVGVPFIGFMFSLFLPPEIGGTFISILPMLVGIAVILGPLGGLTGWKIFDSIRERAIVVRLRGE